MKYAMATPTTASSETSNPIGPNVIDTTNKSRCTGPSVGVTAVVKNSFAAPCGRQRRVVLLQIEPGRLPRDRFRLGVVEQVVGDLKRHAQPHPEAGEGLAVGGGGAQGPHLAGPGEQ